MLPLSSLAASHQEGVSLAALAAGQPYGAQPRQRPKEGEQIGLGSVVGHALQQ
jgi:hypothetical protein